MRRVASRSVANPFPPTRTAFLETQDTLKKLRAFQGSSRDPEGRGFVFVAEALLEGGGVDEARQVLEEGLVVHPTLSGAQLLLAKVCEASGDRAGARAACRTLEALDPLNRFLPGLRERLAETADAWVSEAPVVAVVPAASEPAPAPPPEPAPPLAPQSTLLATQADSGSEHAAGIRQRDLDFFEPFVVEPEVVPPTPEAAPIAVMPAPEAALPGNVPQTRTLAELYLSQGHTARAIGIYEALLAQRPGDPELAVRLAELRGEPSERQAALGSAAATATEVSPFDGVDGLEDFSLWLETLPVLPEMTHHTRES